MKIIKDLCKIIDVNDSKYLYNGVDNSLLRIDSILQNILNDKDSIYFNKYCTSVFFDYDMDEIRAKLSKGLSHAIISLTDNCNLRCQYCGYQDTRYKNNSLRSMDESTLKTALDFIISHATDSHETTVSFYGGEPLLYFDLIKLAIEYIENRNYRGHQYKYQITTNGTLLGLKEIEYFVSKNIKCVISLDGPCSIHDRYRIYKEGYSSYADIIKNIKTIANKFPAYYNQNIEFQAVVSPPYDLLMPRDFFDKSKVQYINVSIGDYFSRLLRDKYGLELNGLELKDAVPLQIGDMSKDELIKNISYIGYLKKYMDIGENDMRKFVFPSGFCIPLVKRIFISVNGKIAICEQVDENNPLFQLGDLVTGYDFDKINLLYKYTNSVLAENCNKCWAFRFCRACFKNLDLVKFDGDFCKMIRHEIEQDIVNILDFKFNNKRYTEIMQAISVE
jgi:uncharacterized protein